MALIKETGAIIDGANTYVSRAELISYAALRGVTLADVDATDVLAIKAMDYLALFDTKWKGELVDPGVQSLAWPRKGVYPVNSSTQFPDDQIPGQIQRAQCELALNVNAGTILLPTTSAETAFIKKEKVDVIETEYSEAVALKLMGLLPQMPLVDALLAGWLKDVGTLRTVRV